VEIDPDELAVFGVVGAKVLWDSPVVIERVTLGEKVTDLDLTHGMLPKLMSKCLPISEMPP
jgi:hypothetical protein